MRKAVEGGYYNVGEMQRNPFFKPIRNDKEFKKILALAKQKHLAFKQAIEGQVPKSMSILYQSTNLL